MHKSLLVVAGLVMLPGAALAEDPVFDATFELTAMSDYFDTGLTASDHNPALYGKIAPSYGIAYGSFEFNTIDYGTPEPDFKFKAVAGVAPVFGPVTLDFSLTRKFYDEKFTDYILPYAIATYAFNDSFSAGVGVGYYDYDDHATEDFVELYGAADLTLPMGATIHGETSYDLDTDGAGADYLELLGTVTYPFLDGFSVSSTVSYEGYLHDALPSYIAYDAGVSYTWKDHIVLDLRYYGNDLNSTDCPNQAYTDCGDRAVASITFKTSLSQLQGK